MAVRGLGLRSSGGMLCTIAYSAWGGTRGFAAHIAFRLETCGRCGLMSRNESSEHVRVGECRSAVWSSGVCVEQDLLEADGWKNYGCARASCFNWTLIPESVKREDQKLVLGGNGGRKRGKRIAKRSLVK